MRFCRAFLVTAVLAAGIVPGFTPAAMAQPKPSADEFVPLDEVPPEEQIPAINLVAAAYGFVWIVVVGYVWSLGRRLQRAESEIAALERKGR
jgi:CcmD family protein